MSRRSSARPRNGTTSGASTITDRSSFSAIGKTIAAAFTDNTREINGLRSGRRLDSLSNVVSTCQVHQSIDQVSQLCHLAFDGWPVDPTPKPGSLQPEIENGDGCTQLVSGIGRQPPLSFVSMRETVERAIDSIDERSNLVGQSVDGQAGGEVGRADALGLQRGPRQWTQAPSADLPEKRKRNQNERHHDKQVLEIFVDKALRECFLIGMTACHHDGVAFRRADS